jgi:F-type H+-transporting ATPase subunit b
MPQLDFSTFLPQLFWLAITFGALYALVARMALPRIGGTIEHRRTRVADDIDTAERLKAEAQKALATYESTLAEARAKANATVAETRARMSAELDVERQNVEAKLASRISSAEAAVRAGRDEALKGLGDVIGELSGDIVTRMSGEKVSAAVLKRAVNKVLG